MGIAYDYNELNRPDKIKDFLDTVLYDFNYDIILSIRLDLDKVVNLFSSQNPLGGI